MNYQLGSAISEEQLLELGFERKQIPAENWEEFYYEKQNKKFKIEIDNWFEVKLYRMNPEREPIGIEADCIYDIQNLVDFIK